MDSKMPTYFDVFKEAGAPFSSFEQATQYLDEACVRFGLRHLSYWCVSYSGGAPDQVSWIATYPPEYMNHYMTNYTPIGDPAFEATMSGPLVTDWSDVVKDETVQKLHDVAAYYGIAKHGLSIPIREQGTADVLFSANLDCRDSEWPAHRVAASNIVLSMAHYYHRRVSPLIHSRQEGSIVKAA
jgi:hypothetical protein